MQALDKLTTVVDGKRQIISDPPLIVPVEELFPDTEADAITEQLHAVLAKYRRTLQSDRRHLLEQFTLAQVARKVVGVGSVGTRAWILLMDADDGVDPLFLQAKEAQPSVLADYAGRSKYTNHGQRVVAGQHLMQAASDIFLGWQRVAGRRRRRPRLLRAPAAGLEVLRADRAAPADGMALYAGRARGPWPGHTPAPATGSRSPPTWARRTSSTNAIADFAEIYADQNERDHAALQAAVKEGKAEATTEI